MRSRVGKALEVAAAFLTMALVVWTTAIVLAFIGSMLGCSRPPAPHPEPVAPAVTLDDVCVGPDCALPKPKR